MNYTISKSESTYLKGIGIILIVFHNFFHSIAPVFGENQFEYSAQPFAFFLDYLGGHSVGFVQLIFAFFGHYGVQLFIFLSGYGLMAMYGKSRQSTPFREYILRRLLKLYPAFTIALVLLLLYQFVILGLPFTYKTVYYLTIRYTLLANFIPGKVFTLCGPHWFYSMIIQLYLLFPLLLKLHTRSPYSLRITLVITLIILIFTNDFASSHSLSLYYNFPGNLPVFLFGMILAGTPNVKSPQWLWLTIAVTLFIVGQFTPVLWYFTPIAFVVMVVPVCLFLYRSFPSGRGTLLLLRTGEFSMYLFAVHGFMRVPWNAWFERSTPPESIIYLLLFVVCIWVAAYLTRIIERIVMPFVTRFFISRTVLHE